MKQDEITQTMSGISDLNVIDLILIDHNYIKRCISKLLDPDLAISDKVPNARNLLNTIAIHSRVEKKTIYQPLENEKFLCGNISKAKVEHGVIDRKVKSLKIKLSRTRIMKEEVEIELKLFADLVKSHFQEEESVMLPLIQKSLSKEAFGALGKSYMKQRKFTKEEFKDYPQLQDDLIQWKDSVQKVSNEFLIKMDKFMDNIHH